MVVEHVEPDEVIVLESVAVWPDGEWCFTSDLEEYMAPPCAKSDDFEVMPYEYAVSRGWIEEE